MNYIEQKSLDLQAKSSASAGLGLNLLDGFPFNITTYLQNKQCCWFTTRKGEDGRRNKMGTEITDDHDIITWVLSLGTHLITPATSKKVWLNWRKRNLKQRPNLKV